MHYNKKKALALRYRVRMVCTQGRTQSRSMGIDESAVAVLYRRYVGMLRLSCERILGDPHSAEDAVQEAFIKYIKYAKTHKVERPAAVLYRSALNTSLTRLRARNKNYVTVDEHSIPDARQQVPEHRLAVLSVLLRADPEEAEIAIMHFVEGLSHDEIANVTGLSSRTIGNRLNDFCRRAAKIMSPAARLSRTTDEEYKSIRTSFAGRS